MSEVEICLLKDKCRFKRWKKVSHDGTKTPWLIPVCIWDETCNQKRKVKLKSLVHSELFLQIRRHVDSFRGKIIPLYRGKKKRRERWLFA